jgi:CHAT domain-containing protein
MVPLGLERGWESRLENSIALLENESETRWREHLREWGETLLSPAGLFSARSLVIVPDGPLALLPFEALPTGGALALEQWEISYLPTTALHASPPPGWRKWPWQKQALALGLSSARGLLPGDERWAAMPRAEEEATAVGRLLPGDNLVALGPACRRELIRRSDGYGVLHLATHAAADLEDPSRSRILLPGDDGPYFTLPDAASLDLRGVSLVTLSACETERGRLIRGEGVQSFGRAFLQAGAGAVVASLWPVEDHATTELMKQFYAALGRGDPKGEALRSAKLRLLRSGSRLAHPANWAAFVLSGDAASPLDLPATWADLVTAAAVAAAFVAFVALWVRPRFARLPDVQVRVRSRN